MGLSTTFLHRAVERGIEVVLLSENGTLGGRIIAPTASDPSGRRAQYAAADDGARARQLASAVVGGKIGNMRVTLLRVARRADDVEAAVSADRLETVADAVPAAAGIPELLGLEGSASREYMQGPQRLLEPEWGFEGRRRRPPPEPVNAMLSYGYTLLCHEAIGACEAAGLDPNVGFLHQHRWGRPALALDLMEEFRPITVDVAVWRCISTRQIRPEQFTTEPDVGCRMADDAKHAFVAAYERPMLTLTSRAAGGRRVSFRVAMSLQAKMPARAVLDSGLPLRWK